MTFNRNMRAVKLKKNAAKRFFNKMLANGHCKLSQVINTDKAKAFPPAIEEEK